MSTSYKPSIYNHFIDIKSNGDYLLFNARTGKSSIVQAQFVSQVQTILDDPSQDLSNFDPALIQSLVESNFINPTVIDELDIVRTSLMKRRHSISKKLMMVILPTHLCNFNCVYCFESEETRANKSMMPHEVQDNIIRFTKQQLETKTLPWITVEWFGGEPLLGFPVIDRLSQSLMKLCQDYNVPYNARMISNLYAIDEAMIKKLVDYKVKEIMVTLDGPKRIHDTRRVLKGGQGTYDRIVKNIELVAPHIPIILRIHVQNSSEDVMEVLHYFKDKPCKDNLFIQLTDTLEADNINPAILDGQEKEASKIRFKFYDILKKYQFKSYGGLSIKPKQSVCVAEDVNGYAIGPYGELYSCTRDIGIKKFTTGNITDLINQSKVNKDTTSYEKMYMEFDPTTSNPCKTCNILPLCMSGCRKRNLEIGTVECPPIKFHLHDILIKKTHEALKQSAIQR